MGKIMNKPIFDESDNFDEKYCLSIYDNSYDFYVAVLETFARSTERELEELIQSMEEDRRHDYWILVHGLKSSSESVGAKDLHQLVLKMDLMYKAGDWNSIVSNHEELIRVLSNTIYIIRKRLE